MVRPGARPSLRPSTAQTLSRRRRGPRVNRGPARPAVDRTGTEPSTAGPSRQSWSGTSGRRPHGHWAVDGGALASIVVRHLLRPSTAQALGRRRRGPRVNRGPAGRPSLRPSTAQTLSRRRRGPRIDRGPDTSGRRPHGQAACRATTIYARPSACAVDGRARGTTMSLAKGLVRLQLTKRAETPAKRV